MRVNSVIECPRQDSNLCTRLRRAVLYPLSYGGAFEKIISEFSCQDALVNQRAYFATGCFWGAERRFWNLPGVISTSVGYMGGTRPSPSYEQVCTGTTNHAETVEVVYDPTQISYQRLLEEFWTMHDPTSLNKQGGDIGTQYRSAIFTTSEEQMIAAINTREIYNDELSNQGYEIGRAHV